MFLSKCVCVFVTLMGGVYFVQFLYRSKLWFACRSSPFVFIFQFFALHPQLSPLSFVTFLFCLHKSLAFGCIICVCHCRAHINLQCLTNMIGQHEGQCDPANPGQTKTKLCELDFGQSQTAQKIAETYPPKMICWCHPSYLSSVQGELQGFCCWSQWLKFPCVCNREHGDRHSARASTHIGLAIEHFYQIDWDMFHFRQTNKQSCFFS